jgi:hypothetical protein
MAAPGLPPNPVESGGYWQERNEFSGSKSFGHFVCNACRKSSWISAHAYKHYKQACKRCNRFSLPALLWVNTEYCRDEMSDLDVIKKKPHRKRLCEACKKGVCSG